MHQVEVDLLQKTVRVVFDSICVQAEQLKRLLEEAGFNPLD
ncbi:MAG: hypothetical protein ACK4UU_04655 [Fimbriimonadales bacterium]